VQEILRSNQGKPKTLVWRNSVLITYLFYTSFSSISIALASSAFTDIAIAAALIWKLRSMSLLSIKSTRQSVLHLFVFYIWLSSYALQNHPENKSHCFSNWRSTLYSGSDHTHPALHRERAWQSVPGILICRYKNDILVSWGGYRDLLGSCLLDHHDLQPKLPSNKGRQLWNQYNKRPDKFF